MNSGARFLTVVSTYAGYCEICHEPHVVGHIAVAGWPFHGAVCSRCLTQMAEEVQQRAKTIASGAPTSSEALTASVTGDANALAATLRGNGNGR